METKNELGGYRGDTSDFPMIDRALAGEQLAYEELFKKYRGRIFKFFMRKTGNNNADSEDMVQDTFALAFCKLHTFEKSASFNTWLYRIAVNVFLMSCRRRKHCLVSIDELYKQQIMNGELIVESTLGGDEFTWDDKKSNIGKLDQALENVPNEILVSQLMRNLPSGYKKILELHDLQELNYEAVAAKLQHKVGTAKSQRHKAIEKLRTAVKTTST